MVGERPISHQPSSKGTKSINLLPKMGSTIEYRKHGF